MPDLKPIYVYTDGACQGNPGPGGWAAILIYGRYEKILCGGEHNTTNNRMELTAAIQGLSAIKSDKIIKKKHIVYLITDSLYIKNGIEVWIVNWKKNNWRTASRKSSQEPRPMEGTRPPEHTNGNQMAMGQRPQRVMQGTNAPTKSPKTASPRRATFPSCGGVSLCIL